MKNEKQVSILFPYYEDTQYRQLSETACHDLGLDTICKELTSDIKEQNLIMSIISNMTGDERVAKYRQKVFVDILNLPYIRKRMTELFERIEFLKDFGTAKRKSNERLGIWGLLHRLYEIDDYIECVEAMRECLSDAQIKSEGLKDFRDFINEIYEDSCFAQMKEDISKLKVKTSDIKSITVGINLNERFEATSLGLVSINKKSFKKSGILSNFADAITAKNKLREDSDWKGDMHYHQPEDEEGGLIGHLKRNAEFYATQDAPFLDRRIRTTIANVAEGDDVKNSTFYLENVANKILDTIIRRLREVLAKYSDISIMSISKIIPEFLYYIKFAEFIEKNTERGFPFCEAETSDGDDKLMNAQALYNLKLALGKESKDDIVYNDLIFDREHTVYILTGAKRGGKTTVTQAVGMMFALAQGGIFVPAKSFKYKPVDCIYTHFPADEDKTMDLGRLGEECVRFKEIYTNVTKDSLVLLNETFSTTSFEEGYYIAKDSVKALLKKQVRTIYNTHMHKLAADTAELNSAGYDVMTSSIIVKSEEGKRSFKIEEAEPEGMSYARDIAEKYGVTYEMLTEEKY
ncbi:MAG: DNA mismatch repair protein [Firmicutes bacterium]|nr:DNA mismatch repair protein [Bacillota bacterium]